MSTNSRRGKVYQPGYDRAAGGIQVGNIFLARQDMKDWTRAVNEARSKYFPRRRLLHELYSNIILDGHLQSVMGKRSAAVTNKELRWFVDGQPEPEGSDDVHKTVIKTPWFLRFLEGAMSAVPYGTTVLELVMKKGEIHDVAVVPRGNVSPERGLVLTNVYDTDHGIAYRDDPYWSKYLVEVGEVDNYGGLMVAAMYVLYKRGGFASWAQFMELFGMPLRKGTYNPYDQDSRAKLTTALANMGAASYIVVPDGTNVEFITAQGNGQNAGQVYDTNIERCNAEMSKLFLGQTLTTEQGKVGTQALGTVHADTQDALTAWDMKRIEFLLNYELRPRLNALGYPLGKGEFGFYHDTALPPMERITVDMQVAKVVPISDAYWYKTYNIPPPTAAELAVIEKRRAAAQAITERQGEGTGEQQDKGKESKKDEQKEPEDETDGRKAIEALYAHSCERCATYTAEGAEEADLERDPIWQAIVKGLHDGTIKDGHIDPDLLNWTAHQLTKAVTGSQLGDDAPASMLTPEMQDWMRKNVFVFSGFKTYQTLRAASDMLMDEHGQPRSFADFRDRVQQIDETYNVQYLRAEYQHAVACMQMAQKWMDAQANKDIYPFAKYVTAGDERVRPVHEREDGVVEPLDASYWHIWWPPNDWGCRCDVELLATMPTGAKRALPDALPPRTMFAGNVGVDGVIFPSTHPYSAHAGQDVKDAVEIAIANAARSVAKTAPTTIGPDPTKPKVSAALSTPSAQVRRILDHTMKAIDSVHSDGTLTPIPIKTGIKKKGVHGLYAIGARSSTPIHIMIRPKAVRPHFTLAHETGHYLDHSGIGANRMYATEGMSIMEPVRNAIKNSKAYKAHLDILSSGRLTRLDGTTVRIHEKMRRHIEDYLITPAEQWARAYAQYISTRSGSDVLKAELEAELESSNTTVLYEQWQPDDFEPIAKAIDELFLKLGWRK